MMAAFTAGDTFLMSGVGKGLHLFVVLCDPSPTPPTILTVMVSTLRTMSDMTVILQPGDHSFIAHESSIEYDQLRPMLVDLLLQLEKQNNATSDDRSFVRKERVSPELLGRIIQGAFDSVLTEKGMVRELKKRRGL